MISYVKGPLVTIEEDVIAVEVGHVGLTIHVSVSLLPELPRMGEEVTVYAYFQAREDVMTLYGFLHSQNRDMFRQLLGVNGIGPKGTLGVLSVLRPDDLRLAIINEDVKTLTKAPGISNKTVRHLALNLKGRISMDGVLGNVAGGVDMNTVDTDASVTGLVKAAKEAVQVLVALNYISTEASRAVKQVEVMDRMTSEDVSKVSLKHLSFL